MAPRILLRRAGADLAQAMFYAAFAIFLMVSVLYGYAMIDLGRSKTETTHLMAFLTSNARGLYTGQPNMGDLSAEHLIRTGSVPLGFARENGSDSTIVAPYGGVVSLSPTGQSNTFRVTIEWPGGSAPKRMCLHLVATDEVGEGSGPLGTAYFVESADCYADNPHISAIYFR